MNYVLANHFLIVANIIHVLFLDVAVLDQEENKLISIEEMNRHRISTKFLVDNDISHKMSRKLKR